MNKLKAFFVGIWHLFKPVEEKAISDFEQKIEQAGPKFLEIGVDAVKYAGTLATGSDTATRDAAREKLVEDAKAEGIDIANFAKNELNTVIELCYLAAKPSVDQAAGQKDAANETGAAAHT